MKLSKRIIDASIGLVASLSLAGMAHAAASTFPCRVASVQTADTGQVRILLERTYANNRTAKKWFAAPAAEGKNMLAVALTSISLGLPVKAKIDWALPSSDIEILQLDSP